MGCRKKLLYCHLVLGRSTSSHCVLSKYEKVTRFDDALAISNQEYDRNCEFEMRHVETNKTYSTASENKVNLHYLYYQMKVKIPPKRLGLYCKKYGILAYIQIQ